MKIGTNQNNIVIRSNNALFLNGRCLGVFSNLHNIRAENHKFNKKTGRRDSTQISFIGKIYTKDNRFTDDFISFCYNEAS